MVQQEPGAEQVEEIRYQGEYFRKACIFLSLGCGRRSEQRFEAELEDNAACK